MAATYTVRHEGAFSPTAYDTGSFACGAGKLLLARVHAQSSAFTSQTGTTLSASGWTPLTGSDSDSSPGWGYASRLFYKIASGSTESLSASATFGAAEYWKITVLELDGYDTGTPFRQVAKDTVGQFETTSTSFTFSSAPLSSSLVLAFIDVASNGGTQTLDPGPSGGFTEDYEGGVTDWLFCQWPAPHWIDLHNRRLDDKRRAGGRGQRRSGDRGGRRR